MNPQNQFDQHIFLQLKQRQDFILGHLKQEQEVHLKQEQQFVHDLHVGRVQQDLLQELLPKQLQSPQQQLGLQQDPLQDGQQPEQQLFLPMVMESGQAWSLLSPVYQHSSSEFFFYRC